MLSRDKDLTNAVKTKYDPVATPIGPELRSDYLHVPQNRRVDQLTAGGRSGATSTHSLFSTQLHNRLSSLAVASSTNISVDWFNPQLEEDELREDDSIRNPYSWFTLAVCSACVLIALGVTQTFGLMLEDLKENLDTDEKIISWIPAVNCSLQLLGGLLAGFLCSKVPPRFVIMCGFLAAAFGFAVSSLARSIWVIIANYGVVSGLGCSMIMVPCKSIATLSFSSRWRLLASALVVTSEPAGMFIIGLLTNYFLEQYGWRGATLLRAGMLLQGIWLALLLWEKKDIKPVNEARSEILSLGNTTVRLSFCEKLRLVCLFTHEIIPNTRVITGKPQTKITNSFLCHIQFAVSNESP